MKADEKTMVTMAVTKLDVSAPPVISRARWTSRRTSPRLVKFSWGAVTAMNSQR